MMKNDITYEYRVFTNRLVDVDSMEVGICTSKVIKELKPKDKVSGRFFHTTDTDEWFFCWKGELQKLNLRGITDINGSIEDIEDVIGYINVSIDEIKKNIANVETSVKEYADGLSVNYDAAGAADAAQAAAEATASADATSKANAAEIAAKEYADGLNSEMDERVTKLEEINYEKISADASASAIAAIVAGADSDFDTLKEVANWIGSHKEGAAELQTTVSSHTDSINTINGELNKLNSNKQNVISDLETIRSGAAAGASALSDAKTYVDGKVDGKFDATGAAAKALSDAKTYVDGKVDGKFDTTGSAAKALSDAKTYADGKFDVLSGKIPSLDGYATEGFVSGEIAKIKVPNKVSELENDSNYLTEHQDITGKQDVIKDLDSIRSGAALGATALQSVPAEYITETELNNKKYLTEQSLNGYATKEFVSGEISKIPTQTVPTKVSQLENDSNYITDQSLNNYFTKEEINALIGDAIAKTNTILDLEE